jgi:hypothetical protein
MNPNLQGALERTSKISELFSVSKTTLTLVLKRGAHCYKPQFRPPISANLRIHIDERQFHFGDYLGSNFSVAFQYFTYPTSHDEVPFSTGPKREALGLALSNIQGEPRAFPHFILSMIDVEGRPVDHAEQYVVIADDELALAKAHGQASIATPAGLEEHDRPAIAHQVSEGFNCRGSCVDSWWLQRARHETASLEEPERLGAVAHQQVLRL